MGIVNTLDVVVLSHIWRRISEDVTKVFARLARDYGSNNRKRILGPFFTMVARYFNINIVGLGLRLVSGSIVPMNNKSLVSMGIVRREKG